MMSASAITFCDIDCTIAEFFNKRYSFLKTKSSNILFRIRVTNQDHICDLVTSAFDYVTQNKDKLYQKIMLSGMLEAICVNYMNYQILWNDTKFKTTILYPKKPKHRVFNYHTLKMENKDCTFIDSDDVLKNYYMEDEFEEEYFIGQELDYQTKLTRMNSMLDKMTVKQRCLFDIVYIKGHNSAEKLNVYFKDYNCESRTTCYTMLKNLRNYIKENL